MERPVISEASSPEDYVREMIRFRKASEDDFSVLKSTKALRRVSPALVSLIVKKRRKLTLDRVDEFARLLNLNLSEKLFFRQWVSRREGSDFIETVPAAQSRKVAGLGLLSDWLNLYVKDLFLIPRVQQAPDLIEKILASLAPLRRIRRARDFLLREGYLRRKLDHSIVVETNLSVTDPGVPTPKIRQFHKNALHLASLALDLHPIHERSAHTFLLALDKERHQELLGLMQSFLERVQDFAAEDSAHPPERLFQLLVNISPVGGKLE